ncbi:histidine kinase N-terminal 7TM domain-containing protein [Halorubellus sp. PRR65]|uniref:histidine kinase N-terminal 7TM domain-containing protein n=1 Tax=Halorubellus sp. PRR65 TaxID=3098148 RepID=UPI002B262A83|nr:histidine kinase N-terminal 7TM domain-containing protein [Halorubellus sp. PRR65]
MGGVPFLSVVLAVAAVATGFLAYLGYVRRDSPGARTFAILASTMAFYSAVYAVSLPVEPGLLRNGLGALQWFGIAPLPVAWLLFALEYSGRPEYLTRRVTVALSVVPAIAVAAAVAHAMPVSDTLLVARLGDLFYPTTSASEWMGHTFISHGRGPLYLLYLGFAYVYFVTGAAILVEFVVRFDRLYKHQAATLVVGALVPWVGNVVAVLGAAPIPGLDVLPFTLPVTAALFANAIFRYDLLDFVPATRRRGASALVSEMRDAVVVVDDADRVVDVNPAASARFDLDRERALGASLSSVADVTLAPDEDLFEVVNDGNVYEVTVSPVHDRYGSVIGRTLVFRDITAHRDAQQRLEVLNRVLRHNLRTEVNVISGYARMVERQLDGDDASMAAEISTAAGTLDELGQKAREVERIMSRDGDAATYALADLLEAAVGRVTDDHPDVVVDVYAPSRSVQLDVDAVVFEAVVADLVDALAHYGNDVVSVRALTLGDDLTVRVSDDGSGIPASEYEVVRRGEETPLEHASGLSLWLVKWGVRSLDGEVEFDDDGDAVLDIAGCVAGAGPSATSTGAQGSVAAADGGDQEDSAIDGDDRET